MPNAERPEGRPTVPAPPPGCDPDAIVIAYHVFRDFAGMRLDRFIQRRIPRLSRARAQEVVRQSAFTPDGRRRRPGELVREGEQVLLVREGFEEPETPTDFGVLFEDATLLAIDKPAGLPVHRSASYHRNTLGYLLRERYAEGGNVPRIAHRLDRETSGVVLCARTRAAERFIKHGFETRRWSKRYLAIVHGAPEPAQGVIALPLAPVQEGLHVMMEVREGAAPAETEYRVVERRGDYSLVSLSPRTGRQHQLRVHLSAIGYPIVGDKLYGPEGEAPFLERIETGLTPELLARLELPRHALHAAQLDFAHPEDGAPLSVSAPLPGDMAEFWDARGIPGAVLPDEFGPHKGAQAT